MRDKPYHTTQEYFHAFIRTAQYIPNLTSQQDILSETGKVLVNFYGADLIGFFEQGKDGGIEGHHWILPGWVSGATIQTTEIEEIVTCVFETGFLSAQQIEITESFATVFLPIVWENQTAAVMLVGHRTTESIPKELLDIYLAVAGLVSNAITGADEEFKNIAARKHAEEALKGAQAQLAFLVSNTPVVLYRCRASGDFPLTFISENVRDQLGYEAHEFIDDPAFWPDHIHPDDRKQVFSGLHRLIEDDIVTYEYRFITKDGIYRWIRDEVKVFYDSNGQPGGFLGYWVDITERRNAEEALRESMERFRAIFDQTFHFMGILDRQGNLIEINTVAIEYLTSEEIEPSAELGKPFWLTHWWTHDPIQQERLKRAINRTLSGEVVRFEATHSLGTGLIHVDFSLKPVMDKAGNTILIIAEGWNITERKRAEEGLRLKNQIFETIAEGVNLIRASDGVIVYTNSKFEKMFGYDTGELIGKHISVVNAPDGPNTPGDKAEEIMRSLSEKSIWRGEIKNIRKDRTILRCFVIVTTFEHPEFGKVWISAHTDITERKKAEEELLESEKRNRDRLETLLKLAKMESASERELLDYVLDSECRLTDSPFAFIGTMTQDETIFDVALWSKAVMEQCSDTASSIHLPIEKAGFWAEALRRQEPFMVNDCLHSMPEKKELCGHVPISRFISVPIFEGQRIVMVAAVANKNTPYHDTDVNNLVLLVQDVWNHLQKHKTEEELRESERRYRDMFEINNAVMLIIDPKTGEIVDANASACRYYGYRREEFSSLVIMDINIADPEVIHKKMAHAENGQGEVFQFQHRKKNGEIRDVEVFSAPITLGDRHLLHSIIQDVTDRKLAELALHESREMYRELVENINDVIFSLDLQGKFTYISPAIERLYGYLPEEMTGHHFSSYIHPEDRPFCIEVFKKRLNGEYGLNEFRIVAKDGGVKYVIVSQRPILKNGKIAGFNYIMTDITERKLAEEVVRESESRLNSVIQGSPIPQFVIDQNHRILYWNEALEKASGIKEEEVIGTTYHWKAFYDTERPTLADLLLDGLSVTIPQWYEDKYTRSKLIKRAFEATDFFPKMGKEGTWLFFTAAPVIDGSGNVIGAVETLEDITERRHAEEALLENHFLLEEAMDQGSMAYWELDVPTNMFTFNDRFYALYGTTAEREGGYLMPAEVYAQRFVYPDEINLVRSEIDKSLKTSDPAFFSEVEHRIIRKDGEVRYIVVRYRITKDINGQTLKTHGVNQDITARKRAEEALQAAVKLNQLIDTMSIGECMSFALDEAERLTASKIGFFHFLNPDEQTIHLIAWSMETRKHCFIPKEPDRHYPVDKAGVWVDSIRERKPVIHNDYASLPNKKGLPEGHVPVARELVVPIFYEDRIVAIIGVGNKGTEYNDRDINILTLVAKNTWTLIQRKQVEEALRESEEKFRDIFNNTNDAIHIHEIQENGTPGRYVDVNDVACHMLGYTKEELLARSPLDISTGLHIPSLEKIVEDQQRLGRAIFETEHRRKDGTIIPVEVNTHVVTIQEKEVILGVVRDITDRKKSEELLKRFNEELEEKVKIRTDELNVSLAEKVILLREIHHRVKNNLQVIVSLINIQSRGITDEKIRSVLRETQARVKAISIVHEKMYLEKDVNRIDLGGYVKSLATTMMSAFQSDPNRVRVIVDIRDVTLDIETAVPVGLILNELIANAFKHAFPEGNTGTITVLGHYDDEFLHLTVQDNGAGLPDGFDSTTVKSIGMQLIRILVTQLNGSLEFHDQGGVFVILKIPLKRRNSEIHQFP